MGTMKCVLYRQLFVIYIFPLRLCHCPKGNLRLGMEQLINTDIPWPRQWIVPKIKTSDHSRKQFWLVIVIMVAIFIMGNFDLRRNVIISSMISVLINCSIPSLVSDNLISYSPRAHIWRRFCWRSRLVKLDFAFSLVKNEMLPAYF
jgi:hypothetical protein